MMSVANDFLQLLIQLRNTGAVQLENEWKTVIKSRENQKTLTDNMTMRLRRQHSLFFGAGFEISSTTLSFCLYELNKQSKIHQLVRHEIDEVIFGFSFFKCDSNQIETQNFTETRRKYSTLTVLNRMCLENSEICRTD